MLGRVARQAADVGAEPAEGAPAGRAQLRGRIRERGDLLGDPTRIAFRAASEPFELGVRQPERLADVANRPARVVGREARNERGVLPAVAVADGRQELLADVARKVEVDVGDAGHLPVQEPPQRQAGCDGVHVREAGQVADDRADRAAAAAARRQDVARDRATAHLERALAGELEHLPVAQEEP